MYLGIILFLVKLVTDLPIYAGITSFTKKTRLLWYLVPMQILYIIYVSLIGFVGNFVKLNGRAGWVINTCFVAGKQRQYLSRPE